MPKTIISVAAAAYVIYFAIRVSEGGTLSFAAFFTDPWVAIGITDLFFGFVLMSVVMATVEGSFTRAAPWIIGMFIVGNLVPAVYLILHYGRLSAPFAAMKDDL